MGFASIKGGLPEGSLPDICQEERCGGCEIRARLSDLHRHRTRVYSWEHRTWSNAVRNGRYNLYRFRSKARRLSMNLHLLRSPPRLQMKNVDPDQICSLSTLGFARSMNCCQEQKSPDSMFCRESALAVHQIALEVHPSYRSCRPPKMNLQV